MWRQGLENCPEVLVSPRPPPASTSEAMLSNPTCWQNNADSQAGFTLRVVNSLCTPSSWQFRGARGSPLGQGGTLTLHMESFMLGGRASLRAQCGPSAGAETPGASWLRAKLCMLTPRAGAETRAAEPGARQSPRARCAGPPQPSEGPSEEAAGRYGRHLPSLRGKWVRHGDSHPSPFWTRERTRTRGVRAGPAEGTGSPGGGRLGVG